MNNSSTSSSKPAPGTGIKLLLSAGFLGGFLGILAFANAAVRPPQAAQDIWYGPVIDAYGQGYKANFLFVGTSRTRAAVRAEVWDSVMGSILKIRTSSVNLGMGWCTPMEHWHGLHKLVSAYPDALRGTAVLIEAGEGMGLPTRWTENWIVEDRRDLLVPYMTTDDLGRLWRSSTPGEHKFAIAADLLFPSFDQFPRLRHTARTDLDTFGQGFVEAIWSKPPPANTAANSDLSTAGGIRADKKGVELAMFMAESASIHDLKHQEPYGDWDSTIYADIVKLVRDAGGVPLFVRIPYSPTQAKPLETPLRQADKARFEEVMRRWGIPKPVISGNFPTTVDDFPDKWHLRKSLAPAFTKALAIAYLEAFLAPTHPLAPDTTTPRPQKTQASPPSGIL